MTAATVVDALLADDTQLFPKLTPRQALAVLRECVRRYPRHVLLGESREAAWCMNVIHCISERLRDDAWELAEAAEE